MIHNLKLRSFECSKCGKTNEYLFFHSKKEARYYCELELMRKAGVVKEITQQKPYIVPLESGERIRYILDFLVEYTDGHTEYVDVKGKRLPHYIDKKKLVENHYHITIKEV
jgi:hypothetical protein